MMQYELELPEDYTWEDIEPLLEGQAQRSGFELGSRSSLQTVPGSSHWHATRGEGSGTLEFTHDPEASCLIVSVHDDRRGEWAGEAAPAVATALLRHLRAG